MGPIHMNEVKCLGQEKSIWNCPYKNITSEDCQHVEDAAIICNTPYMGVENSVRVDLLTYLKHLTHVYYLFDQESSYSF